MSKHTKGPWSVTYTHGKGYPGQIEADNGTLITTWGGICRKSTAEGQANAELMAAAPDLLEALEDLFADYKRHADSGDAGYWKVEDLDAGKKALAAIKKARGEA